MSGQNSFLPQAVDMVRQAIEADNNKEYEKAHTLYTNSLERFILAIKCTFFFLLMFRSFFYLTKKNKKKQMRKILRHENYSYVVWMDT